MDDPRADVPDSQATGSPGSLMQSMSQQKEAPLFLRGLGSVVLLEFINTAITCGPQMK